MTFEQVVFFVLAAVAAFSAIMVILQRNPVNSALYLILNFFCLSGLYLTLNAQFIAMVQVLVYAWRDHGPFSFRDHAVESRRR